MNGPRVRTDIVDVYIIRAHQLLLLRRSRAPMVGQWHPIMGHVEPGERATDTALREMHEEVGLRPERIDAWYQLEQTFPFFLADRDEVHLSPRFVAIVHASFEPALNSEHDALRWIDLVRAEPALLWPGQRHALREIIGCILPGGPTAEALRLPLPGSA